MKAMNILSLRVNPCAHNQTASCNQQNSHLSSVGFKKQLRVSDLHTEAVEDNCSTLRQLGTTALHYTVI